MEFITASTHTGTARRIKNEDTTSSTGNQLGTVIIPDDACTFKMKCINATDSTRTMQLSSDSVTSGTYLYWTNSSNDVLCNVTATSATTNNQKFGLTLESDLNDEAGFNGYLTCLGVSGSDNYIGLNGTNYVTANNSNGKCMYS